MRATSRAHPMQGFPTRTRWHEFDVRLGYSFDLFALSLMDTWDTFDAQCVGTRRRRPVGGQMSQVWTRRDKLTTGYQADQTIASHSLQSAHTLHSLQETCVNTLQRAGLCFSGCRLLPINLLTAMIDSHLVLNYSW